MRRDHPLAGTDLTLESYCAALHLQVSVSGRARSSVDEVLAKLGYQRITLLTVNQYFTAGKVIANSNLITILPFHLIEATGMSGLLVWKKLPLPLPELNVDMLWHERDARSPAHNWLRNKIVETVEVNRGDRPSGTETSKTAEHNRSIAATIS